MVNPCGVRSVTFMDLNDAVGCLTAEQAKESRISGTAARSLSCFISSYISLTFHLHFATDDAGFERELPVHHAMHGALDAVMAFPELLAHEVEAYAGWNLHPELGFLDPAEAD